METIIFIICLIVYKLGKDWLHNVMVDNYPQNKIDHAKFMNDVGHCSSKQLETNMIQGKYDKR